MQPEGYRVARLGPLSPRQPAGIHLAGSSFGRLDWPTVIAIRGLRARNFYNSLTV